MAFVGLAYFDPRIAAIIAFFSALSASYALSRFCIFDVRGKTAMAAPKVSGFIGTKCIAFSDGRQRKVNP
jgi:hypothetical protein